MPSPKKAASGDTHVLLLRGVNVGGKNKLPMKELAALCLGSGCTEATTFIQSGNVVVKASAATVKKLPAVLEKAIATKFGFTTPVILRSAAELANVVAANPFGKKVDVEKVHVAFLADQPAASLVATLDPSRSPPDEIAVVGRDVYLHLPNGVGKTKITNAYLDSKLKTSSTLRNWRTIQKLIELSA
jgi:uncharacterized protein (DUF1697 family)